MKALVLVLLIPCILVNSVYAASQEQKTEQAAIDAAIAEKLVNYDPIQTASINDMDMIVGITDTSRFGLEAALRAIASCLVDYFVSTDIDPDDYGLYGATYVIYLGETMSDGSFYKVANSKVFSPHVAEAVKNGGTLAAKRTLGDRMIGEL